MVFVYEYFEPDPFHINCSPMLLNRETVVQPDVSKKLNKRGPCMKEHHPLKSSHPQEISAANPASEAPRHLNGASFDSNGAGQNLSDLRKLQDPSKYDKARFSFRLYKR
jgi:hypothetical protein